jgi:hypothetical protein
MRSFVLIPLCLLVLGCTASNYSRVTEPSLYTALDRLEDGATGFLSGNRVAYEIKSTYKSSSKLCRVVSFSEANRFSTETFCKVKGGEWT